MVEHSLRGRNKTEGGQRDCERMREREREREEERDYERIREREREREGGRCFLSSISPFHSLIGDVLTTCQRTFGEETANYHLSRGQLDTIHSSSTTHINTDIDTRHLSSS